MVEKIIVNPTEVRGYGNIVNVKSDEDYEPVNCTITEDMDTVYGATVNVIVMEPDLGEATTLTVTSSSSTLVLDNTVNISATLKDSSNAAISGATITFKEGTTTLGNSTTNSSGVATYTYTGASVGDHTINAGFAGDSTYASSTGNVSVTVTDHVYSISFNQSSYVATGGSVEISCTLLRDSSPFSGATVSVTGSDSSVYSGITDSSGVATVTVSNISAETTFTASYSGATATCTVTTHTIIFDDSTEYTETRSVSGDTRVDIIPSFNFDASIDFEMTCDVYFSAADSSFGLFPTNVSGFKYHLTYGQDSSRASVYYGNSSGGESAVRVYGTQSFGQYFSLKFVKEGYQVTTYINDVLFSSDIPTTTLGDHGNMNFAFGFWGNGSKTGKVKNLKIVQI